jgi:hypothetical protein
MNWGPRCSTPDEKNGGYTFGATVPLSEYFITISIAEFAVVSQEAIAATMK